MPTKKGRGIIYARPSFLEGMARIFDIGGTLNEYDFGPRAPERDDSANGAKAAADSANGAESDVKILRADWEAVGADMWAAMGYHPPPPAWEYSRSAGDFWEWDGESPTPETLKQYDDALPGMSERILRMVKMQAEHRVRMENLR